MSFENERDTAAHKLVGAQQDSRVHPGAVARDFVVCGSAHAEHTSARELRHENGGAPEQGARRSGTATQAKRGAPGDFQGHDSRVNSVCGQQTSCGEGLKLQ